MIGDPKASGWRRVFPLLIAAGAATVAMLLAWLAMSVWSWRLWGILAVGVLVFAVALYYATVSLYLRMASHLLGVVLLINVGSVGIKFFADGKDQSFFRFAFAYESSNSLVTVVLAVLFIVVVIADVNIKRIEIIAARDRDKEKVSGPQTVTASDRSVSIQNSPGAHVAITHPKDAFPARPTGQTEKLIDTLHQQSRAMNQQASVINRLLMPEHVRVHMEFQSASAQGLSNGYPPIDATTFGDEIPVTQVAQQAEAGIISASAFASSRESTAQTFIAEVLRTLETVDGIVAEIREQLSVWNNDAALQLAGRLEDHLQDIGSSGCPHFTKYIFLLARVHVIRAEKKDDEATAHIELAKGVLSQIDAHLAVSPDSEVAADVAALRASIENLVNGSDAALALLADRNDPYSIRIRLAIFLNNGDPDAAVALVEGRPPHLRWCDLAVLAYAATGRRKDALTLVNWAGEQEDRSKYPQCVVRFAAASLTQSFAGRESGKAIFPQDLSDAEREEVRVVLKILEPVLTPIITAAAVDSELAITAVKIGWQAHHLLGQRDDVASLARLMSTRSPVPPEVARSVMSGYMTPPKDLPDRLREDHPNDLDANILAAVVQSDMGQHEAAFDEAIKLIPLADTNEKKEDLFKLFQQVWQELEGEAVGECERIAHSLIGHNPRLQAVFDASRALRAGDAEEAINLLDSAKAEDDLYWLQLRGNALMHQGQLAEAVDMFLLSARRSGEPMLLRKTADLAFEAEKVAVAVECYEQLLKAHPSNLAARGNLASLYTFHLHDICKASLQFRALHEAEPDNPAHTVNLAICLAQLYRPKESLALYDEACKVEPPDLRAVLGRAELQLSTNDLDAASASLQEFRDIFWDSPDFLLACMNTAYASGEEGFAHEAFSKLNELRSAGIVDEKAFRMVHTDEALAMFKETLKAAEDRKKHIHAEMLQGRIPWISAAQASGDAIYWAWQIRTQDMRWIGDDPVNRASYSIYSTNGFHARESQGGGRALLPLECSPPGTPVVADLSALITLHQLGILDRTAEYFGEILIPQAYLTTVLEDGKKMVLHQRSRQRAAEEISRLLAAKIIVAVDGRGGSEGILPVADEYIDLDAHRYHLTDLVQPVYEAGLMDDSSYQRVCEVCGKPSGVDDEHPALTRLQNIQIELATLETLTTFGLLDVITKFYRVHIASEAQTELRQRLEALRFQDEARGQHFDLWDRIRSDVRFKFVQHTIPQELRDNSPENKHFLALLASFIAQGEGLPLLADERVCQAMILNEQQGVPHAAFGSDAVVLALASDQLGDSGAAEAMLKLMQWRYRFVLPSAAILKTYAAQYQGNPPGLPLREVAEYVHDCMRDTGLFGGPENTDLKDSMAMRLYLSWMNLLAEWLLEVWGDAEFSEDTATQLTEWCVQELLPSHPRVVHGSVKVRIGSLTARLLISHFLLSAHSVANGERVSVAIKVFQAALKLSDEEYLRIVTEILNDTRRTEFRS